MHNFSYSRAGNVAEAIREKTATPGAMFIAGGTNLLDLMKIDVLTPRHLIDITHLDLNKIEDLEDGGLRLGALVTNAGTAYHLAVTTRYPLLSQAILAGASAQLRNMATDGGNLLQRTRCPYFYDLATPCNKRHPGTGCSALKGYNRDHAVLGTSDYCIATNPSDMGVALLALDARVNVSGPAGERTIPMAEFHRLPGDTPHLDHNLQADEIITSIDLPAHGFTQHYTYLKVRDRRSYAFALVSVAAALDLDGDAIREARVALGGVAHKPWRLPAAEALLVGQPARREHFGPAAAALLSDARGFGYNDFKIELAQRAVVRALSLAAHLAPES
jgi:xanthine dehydrogenase YagS FAD-binding subunit